MGDTKHEKSFVDFDKPYEQNLIGLRGVAYFAIGLFLLVVITFGLMAFLLNVLDDQATKTDDAERNPMQLKEKDRLPPEPRLQGAPGFEVKTVDGQTVNLELRNPQAEWEVIHEEYKKIWEDGQKGNDKTYTVLPIDEAKKKYLEQNAAAASTSAEQNQKVSDESRKFVSDSNAGRIASETRR